MEIKAIHYPEGVELSGWPKVVFERRVKRAFEGSSFSICDLDRCRAAIRGESESERAEREEYEALSAFHCVNYKDMTDEERSLLVEKAKSYIGIDLSMARPHERQMVKVVSGYLLKAAVMAAAAVTVTVLSVVGFMRLVDANTDKSARLGDGIPHLSGPVAPQLPALQYATTPHETEPAFRVSMESHAQAATIRKISDLVRDDGKGYVITVTATPIVEETENKEPEK